MGRLERFRKLARLPRLKRFSLRSLLLCVLLIGSGFGLWYRWGPWVAEFRLETEEGDSFLPSAIPVYDRKSDAFWTFTDKDELLVWHGANGALAMRKHVGKCLLILSGDTKTNNYLYLLQYKLPRVKVVDLATRKLVTEIAGPEEWKEMYVQPSDDGRWLACSGGGGLVQIRDTAEWDVKYEFHEHPNFSRSIGFSSMSNRFLIKTSYRTQCWELEHGTKLLDIKFGSTPSPNFTRYLVFDKDLTPTIRTIPAGPKSIEITSVDADNIEDYRFAGDNAVLAIHNEGTRAAVIDATSGKVTAELRTLDEEIRSIAMPDGKALAVMLDPISGVQVLELPSGTVKWQRKGARKNFSYARLAEDSSFVFTVDDGGAIDVWDVVNGRALGGPMSNHYEGHAHVSDLGDYWQIERKESEEGVSADYWEKGSGRLVATLQWDNSGSTNHMANKHGGLFKVERNNDSFSLLRLRRPATRYGFLWLPEFYLTLVLALGLGWSLWRDRKL